MKDSFGKIQKILKRDTVYLIGILLFSINALFILLRIVPVCVNMLKLNQICPNEIVLLQFNLIPLIFVLVTGICLFFSYKYKLGISVILLLNIISFLVILVFKPFPLADAVLTTTKEQCTSDKNFNEWFFNDNPDVCNDLMNSDGVNGSDACYKHTGIVHNNHDLCDKVKDEEDRDWCNIVVESKLNKNNYRNYCQQFVLDDSIWRCYHRFAEINNDCSICDELTDKRLWQRCGPYCN